MTGSFPPSAIDRGLEGMSSMDASSEMQGTAPPRRLGLLTPYKELPGEYVDVLAASPVPVIGWQVVTQAEDSHAPDDLRAMGSLAPLEDGLSRLARWRPDAAMWACTSGSFILGMDGSLQQARDLTRSAGVPVSSTSLAFIAALQALAVGSVAVLSPYPDEATLALVSYLAEWEVDVADMVSLGHPGATSSEQIRASEIESAVAGLRGGDAILLPDTATWGFELWAELHEAAGRPLLTANQVTLWMAFGLLGVPAADPSFGSLAGMVAPSEF